MEVQDSSNNNSYKPANRNSSAWLVAIIFIAVGLLWFGRNAGVITNEFFRVVVSWQMLLIVLGISMLFQRRSTVGGAILMAVGTIFILPKIALGISMGTFWPLVFVVVGIVIIVSLKSNPRSRQKYYDRRYRDRVGDSHYESDGGFINSSSNFNTVRHIVIDPIFKGAILQASFGGTVLDLRKTSLEEGDTYIEIECTFSGVEIYVPTDWNVVIDMQPVFGGVDDKRFRTGADIPGRRLIIRGKITFGGVEIKN